MRLFHKIYAHVFGYFWMPCPLCKEYFGGHEWEWGNTLKTSHSTGNGVCKNCGQEAKRLNKINGYENSTFVYMRDK